MIIQTFYVNPAAVDNAEFIALTAVDLYFKSIPNNRSNASGIINPGVTVRICDVVNGSPRPKETYKQIGRAEYQFISPSSDAQAVTSVGFSNPVVVQTGKFYGVVVDFDDPAFALWTHVAGDRSVGTNEGSPNVTDNRDGQYFQYTGAEPTPVVDAALKFAVNVAKFSTNNVTISLPNHGYEFFNFTSSVDSFAVGEKVFANTSPQAGTVSVSPNSKTVVGTGTTFTALTDNQQVVISSGSNKFIVPIDYITNDTELTITEQVPFANTAATIAVGIVGTVHRVDYSDESLILSGSNASPTNKFAVGQQLTGVLSGATAEIASINHYEIDRITGNIDAAVSGDNVFSPKFKAVKYANGSYVDDNVQTPLPTGKEILTDDTSILASRSLEVSNTSIFDDGSLTVVVEAGTTNPFAAPILDLNSSTIELTSEVIDNTYLATHANSVVYDSEVYNNGVAVNKHYTKKLTLSEGRIAEDLKVFLSAYRPKSSNIRVYAKFRTAGDQEPFDDKLWTPLVETGENAGAFSSSVDRSDAIELEYSVPGQPEKTAALAGSFTTANGSATISSSPGYDPSVDLAAGDTIVVFNELFPDNFIVTTVESVNTTTVTVADEITLNGVIGTGQKIAKLAYGRTAFTYNGNDGVIRYLDTNGGVHDGFVEAQLKVVLLGDPTVRISPRIDQLEMIGVSS